MLNKACEYLKQFHCADGESIIGTDEIAPLQRMHAEFGYFSATIPRLILVGEFKAGKSTLLNALLGGEYAAADILEMTSWIARYWPADAPFCRIVAADGSGVEVPPDLFRQRCQARDFSQEELAKISRVDLGLTDCAMSFSIIDCPGLGSITRENECRMMEAIEDADVLVWVVDVDSIGGMREGALLKRLLSQGMPYLAVLTKCDLISDGDVDEVKDYLCDEFSLAPSRIFATSAGRALEALRQGKDPGQKTGIVELRRFVESEVAPRRTELRRQAERAHADRLRDQALALLDQVRQELLTAKETLERFETIVETLRTAVQGQLELELEQMVRERMFADTRSAILSDIEMSLKAGKGSLSTEAINSVFKRHLGEHYLDEFWQVIASSMTSSVSDLWLKKLKDVKVELEEICQRFHSASWDQLAAAYSPQALALNISAISEETFSTALKTSLGIAGVATIYAVATAHVSLAAAATGVGIPVAAIGAVVSSALFYLQRNKAQQTAALEASMIIDTYIKHFIEDILRPHLFPQIAALNANIGETIMAGFAASVTARLPSAEIAKLLKEAERLQKELRAPMRLC